MGNAYQSRLDRLEAEAVKRSGGNIVLVLAAAEDDGKAIERRIAEQRRERGLRPDDKAVPVVVLSWADQQVL